MSGRIRLGPGVEFDRIRSILAESARPGVGVRIGPGDDALVLDDGIVVSTDLSVEDVHFRRAWLALEEIGYRAAVASLSDLAAMAADVVGGLLSLAVSPADANGGLEEVARGVRRALEEAGGALLGGDLSASPGPLVADVIVLGRAERPVSRVGSRPGDRLWVTGRLGGAAGAVRIWERGSEPGPELRAAFARPSARIAEACWLRERGVFRALVDVSDGLAGDAGHLAAAGGVGVVVDAPSIPLHSSLAGAVGEAAALECGLGGGEDYELLFSAEPGAVEGVRDEFITRFGVELTSVGRVEEGSGIRVVGLDEAGVGRDAAVGGNANGDTGNVGGFDHFPGGEGA